VFLVMPPKAKRRLAGGRKAKKKQARRSPLELEGAFGYVSDDVSASVDWNSLYSGFDELTTPRLWGMGLTHGAVSSKLPLQVRAEAPAKKAQLSSVSGVGAGAANGSGEGEGEGEGEGLGPLFVISSKTKLKDAEGKGRGWFAEAPLPAGALLLVERPLVAVLDAQWRDKAWADCDSADTTALGIELALVLTPSLRALVARHHPVEGADFPSDDEDDESDEEDTAKREAMADAQDLAWSLVDGLAAADSARLQAVVKLNSLGFYTHSEQLCHSGHFTPLTGSGLYALASGFNHSCEPSVSRFSIGDLTAFVTNRPVKAGHELCISYIETELLCAPRSLRSQSLNRDFTCSCTKCVAQQGQLEGGGSGRRFLNVDATVQAELALLQPVERVQAVDAALRGEMASDDDSEEDEEEEGAKSSGPAIVLGKDAQELRAVKALALMQMGRRDDALAVWRQLAGFAARHLPPFDEALAVYATQAALCALSIQSGGSSSSSSSPKLAPKLLLGTAESEAARYVNCAMDAHRVICGCDAKMFRWRYAKEVEIAEVPDDAKHAFWKLVDKVAATAASKTAPAAWADAVEAWEFREEEIPEAMTGPPMSDSSSA